MRKSSRMPSKSSPRAYSQRVSSSVSGNLVGRVAVDLVGRHVDEGGVGAGSPHASSRFSVPTALTSKSSKGREAARSWLGWAAAWTTASGREVLEQPQHGRAIAKVQLVVREPSTRRLSSRRWFQRVSPWGPKKSARMLLSTPWTSQPSAVEMPNHFRTDQPARTGYQEFHVRGSSRPKSGSTPSECRIAGHDFSRLDLLKDHRSGGDQGPVANFDTLHNNRRAPMNTSSPIFTGRRTVPAEERAAEDRVGGIEVAVDNDGLGADLHRRLIFDAHFRDDDDPGNGRFVANADSRAPRA